MPSDSNVGSPASSMPAIATVTVRPETITARPDVADAISTDSRTVAPRRRSSRARRSMKSA